MRVNRFRNIAFVLFLSILSAQAQSVTRQEQETSHDFGTRAGFKIEHGFKHGVSIAWEEEVRLKNLSTSFDKLYSTISFGYKVNPYFKLGASYQFHVVLHDGKKSTNYEKYWNFRHRAFIDLTAMYTYNQWKFSLRERPVVTYNHDHTIDLNEKSNPNFQLRSKFATEYSCFSKPLKPYFSIEMQNSLNAPKLAGNYIDAVYSTIGLKWRIDWRSTLNFYYRFDSKWTRDVDVKYDEDEEICSAKLTPKQNLMHIVGVVYEFNWK